MPAWLRGAAPWIGLFSGPIAWFLSTNLGYTFSVFACGWATLATALPLTIVLAGISVAASALAQRGWQAEPRDTPIESEASYLPMKLVAGAGIALGILFGVIILLQASSTLFMAGCAR